ncbi:MAG: UDP-3-O-(3-hydroxymyristoyl)glucosamine N-acyltransferase [Blastopirellula sp.]|nr:MAG: UDP-3-O-(3-hydroxymyristoyl)glucosamine N-acyltransferase [Blastopirellula sp.]
MGFTLADLAQLVGGTLHGDGDLEITGASIIRDVQAGEISLADRPELAGDLGESSAVAAVVCEKYLPTHIPYILVDDVHASFAEIVKQFLPEPIQKQPGIHPAAYVAESATIEANVSISPGAYIGEAAIIRQGAVIHSGCQVNDRCEVGEGSVLHSGAVLYERTIIGKRCIIHANAVLGAYGFGYDSSSGKHILSAQLGNVELHDDVEIGACTTIDRGTYGTTVIGEGTKVDNQVQIAHNCLIGKHNMLCSQVGIAGSSTTGEYVVMAGQAGLRDHVHIADNVTIGAKSGVVCDLTSGQTVLGAPAIPAKDKKLEVALLSKLPEMRRHVKSLLNRIDKLESAPMKKAS